MPRTYIIAADGTRFEALTARRALRRKVISRIIAGIAILITALFLSAAIIGLGKAAREGSPAPHIAPTADTAISLRAAKKACRPAPRGAMQDCLALYMRHAWSDASTFTPEGKVLVKECNSQYRGRELADCYTQEIG